MIKTALTILLLSAAAVQAQELPSIPSNFDKNAWINQIPLAKSNAPDVIGAFRFICKPSYLNSDDPIVYPGQKGAAHLHTFFGNTKTDANSTYESLHVTGDSSCQGGPLNRSASWMPSMRNFSSPVGMRLVDMPSQTGTPPMPPPTTNAPLLIVEGDSISIANDQQCVGNWTYATQYKTANPGLEMLCFSSSGAGITTMVARRDEVLAKITENKARRVVVTVLIGANDLGVPNTYVNSLWDYVAPLRVAGAKVLVGTILPASQGGILAQFNGKRNPANQLIRAGIGTKIDGVFDFAANAQIGCDTCLTNPVYSTDGTHPIYAAHMIMKNIYASAVDPMLAGVTPTPTPVPPPVVTPPAVPPPPVVDRQ